MEDKTFTGVSLSSINIPSILTESDKLEFSNAVHGLFEVKHFLDKVEAVNSTATIPTSLASNFQNIKDSFLGIYEDLKKDHSKVDSVRAVNQIKSTYRRAIDFKNNFFEISSSNYNLQTCVTIISLSGANSEGLQKQTFSLIEQLEKEVQKASTLNKELEDKAAKSVVSNYANIFSTQENIHKGNATTWLTTAILFTIATILFLCLSFKNDWFNTTQLVNFTDGNKIESKFVYNIPNLITKVFVISILIYLLTFLFRQFAINKNLQTLNNYKKNALNSFTLFTESIGDKDNSSKNALMLQVAKAIYENTTTGYLSSKVQENPSSGILEITKLVGDTK